VQDWDPALLFGHILILTGEYMRQYPTSFNKAEMADEENLHEKK
jgi:hypothetical protein